MGGKIWRGGNKKRAEGMAGYIMVCSYRLVEEKRWEGVSWNGIMSVGVWENFAREGKKCCWTGRVGLEASNGNFA